jgi:hypothetical protein
LADCDGAFGKILNSLEASLPDIELVRMTDNENIDDYTGLIYFFADRTLSNSMKRMLLKGRHVISNVPAEFCGFVDDTNVTQEDILVGIVAAVREALSAKDNKDAAEYWRNKLSVDAFKSYLYKGKSERTSVLCGSGA